MSKQKEKINETGLQELMVSIRRNSQESPCITNFEQLLREVDEPEFVNTVVNDMFRFLTEVFELFGTVDRVPQKKFKSRMLTEQFIEPMRFFGRSRRLADDAMRIRAAIEMVRDEDSKVTVDTERQPVSFGREPFRAAAKIINDTFRFYRVVDTQSSPKTMRDIKSFEQICEDGLPNELADQFKEAARKKMLVWNYIPGVIKAVIQTKRRSLDMDNNSKRFN